MSESKHTSALYSVQTRWFWCNARIQCWSSVSRQRLNASGQGLYYEEDYYQYVALEVCYANDCAQLASSWKWKWSDVWPIIVTHTRNLCSAFNPSKWTHTHIHTHTHTHHEHTPRAVGSQCCGAWGAVGVRCLAQGYHLSRGIEDRETAGHSLLPPTVPAGPETQPTTFGLQVRLSIIRPRLPRSKLAVFGACLID